MLRNGWQILKRMRKMINDYAQHELGLSPRITGNMYYSLTRSVAGLGKDIRECAEIYR